MTTAGPPDFSQLAQARATDRTQPLAGGNLPDVTTNIQDMFVAGDKLSVTLIWHGKVAEILTLQDQFAILKQIGYLPESVHAA